MPFFDYFVGFILYPILLLVNVWDAYTIHSCAFAMRKRSVNSSFTLEGIVK